MGVSKEKEKIINIMLDGSELAAEQVRLVRSVNCLLAQVLTTENEEEFFEGSAEIMKLVASVIKQSNFSKTLKTKDKIPYADQAIEYSMDSLQDHLETARIVRFDN